MGEKLIIRYDQIGSFLFLEVCRPYAQQDSDMIDDAVVARFNLKTGELESVEVLFFESWLRMEGEIRIPVAVKLGVDDEVGGNGRFGAQRASADRGMVIKYDHSGDVLTMDWGDGRSGGSMRGIAEGARCRMNEATGEVEGLAVSDFMARAERDDGVVLPVKAALRLVASAVSAEWIGG